MLMTANCDAIRRYLAIEGMARQAKTPSHRCEGNFPLESDARRWARFDKESKRDAAETFNKVIKENDEK